MPVPYIRNSAPVPVYMYMYHIIRTARLGANSLSRIALLGRHARVARSGKSTTYRIMEESPSPPSPPNARQESISRAFAILMMLSFTSLACCSIAIPDSIDLARAIGEPFDESSIPVSIFRLGTCCGGVAVFLIERHWQLNQLGSPDSMPLSLGRFRLLLLLVLACELSGAVGYTIVTSSIRAKDDSAGSSLLWAVLLLSRWTMGVGDGINFSSIYLFIMGAHAAAERGPKLAHWQTVNIFAIGLGPILSSCATVLPSYARFANVGWVQLTLLSASLAVFILCYPSLDDVPSIEASDTDAATAAPGLGAASRWLVVLGGLLITGLRNFAVGGLEVGSASLLEVQLAFSAKALGLMIGLAFIACTLVRGAYLTLQHGLSNDGWVRAHALLAVIASALFFRGWGGAAWEHHCTPSGIGCDRTARAAFLLVGDVLAFGAHLYGSALTSNAHRLRLQSVPAHPRCGRPSVRLAAARAACLVPPRPSPRLTPHMRMRAAHPQMRAANSFALQSVLWLGT